MLTLLLLTSLFYLNFLSRIIISPLLPNLEQALEISHGQAGSLFLFLSAGYFISLPGSGFISSVISHQRTIVLSSLGIAISLLLMSMAANLDQLRTGHFFLGLAAGVYLPSAIATITASFANRHWGRALSVHELAPNLAFLSAPFIASSLLEVSSWQTIFFVLGILSLLACLTYGLCSRKQRSYGTPPILSHCTPLFRMPAFWLMILIFGVGIMSTLGIYNLLPLFLVSEHGMTEKAANGLVGLSRIPTLLTALMGGYLSDRFGSRVTMGGMLFFSGIVTILLGFSQQWISVWVILQPLLAVCFFPAAFATLASLGPPESRNVVISLTVPLAFFIGGGALPAAVGFAADFGWFGEGISATGLLMAGGALLIKYTGEHKS